MLLVCTLVFALTAATALRVFAGAAQTAERADEHAGSVDAACVVRAGGCVGEADAGFKIADKLRKIEQANHLLIIMSNGILCVTCG